MRGLLVQTRRKLHPLLRNFLVRDVILKHHLFMVFIMCDLISEIELDPRRFQSSIGTAAVYKPIDASLNLA